MAHDDVGSSPALAAVRLMTLGRPRVSAAVGAMTLGFALAAMGVVGD